MPLSIHKLNSLNPLISRPIPLPPTFHLMINHSDPPPYRITDSPAEPTKQLMDDLSRDKVLPPYLIMDTSEEPIGPTFEELSRQEAIDLLLQSYSLPNGEYYEENPARLLSQYYPPESPDQDSGPEITHAPPKWDIWSKVERLPLGQEWNRNVILSSNKPREGDMAKALRGRLITWLCNPRRQSNLFFVEPGFHNIANTSADLVAICESANRLGATYGGLQREDTQSAIAFIALQLAARCPPYRALVAEALTDHGFGILKQEIATQFNKLIARPWEKLSSSHPQYLKTPLVVVLDGWTFRSSPEDEFKLLEVITTQCAHRQPSPLLFIVISQFLMNYPFYTAWEYAQLSYWYPDKRKDIETSLRLILQDSRDAHPHLSRNNEIWPTEENFSQLVAAAAGASGLFDAIGAMITHQRHEDPRQQLEKILKYTSQIPPSTPSDPFSSLHHFYSQFLSDIPQSVRSNTLRLISLVTHRTEVPAMINRDRFLIHTLGIDTRYLWYNIRWILCADDVVRDSFIFFMGHPQLHQEPPWWISKAPYFLSSIHILHNSIPASKLLNLSKWSQTTPLEVASEAYFHPQYALIRFCRGLDYIVRHESCDDHVIHVLREFYFRTWAYIRGRLSIFTFRDMLCGLYVICDLLPDIVRTEPLIPTDKLFIKKCHGVVSPLQMGDFMASVWRDQTLGYVLVGYGDKTVLIILHDDLAHKEGPDDQGLFSMTGEAVVTIYTLDMLDDI